MRPDMGKVVLEKPRRGSYCRGFKARSFGFLVDRGDGLEYEGPIKIPNAMNYGNRVVTGTKERPLDGKSFSDLLGPIENYLRSKVGCDWDDVYSELRHHLGRAPWPVQHILRAHIDVATCVEIAPNGKLYEVGEWGGCRQVSGFYVDPRTAKLCYEERRTHWRRKPEPIRRLDKDAISYVKIDGFWYKGRYREEPLDVWTPNKWLPERMMLGHWEPEWPDCRVTFDDRYSRSRIMIFTGKKSCNKRDLKWIRSQLSVAGR